MPNADWDRVKHIFHEVLEKTGPERDQLLRKLCGDDSELRSNVQTLLAAYRDAGPFMDDLTIDGLDPVAAASIGLAAQEPPEGLGTRIGPYKILQVIGEGGFGVVYMAEQEEPIRRRVALKVIKPGMDTKQVIARFEAERQALAMMDHPNIAKVFEAGTTPAGRPYFVMELVKGVTITDYCDEHRLDTRERLALFTEVCGAVQHAHENGIIHRDIKPSNVMVTLHDGAPVPKVIDFGVAKATQQRLTDTTLFTEYNQFIGTPTYVSPEQATYEGLDVDGRADVYSLGVLLYELLTGTTPHDSQALKRAAYLEVIRILKEDEPPKPSTRIQTMGKSSEAHAKHRDASAVGLAKVLRGDLDWIVMKALEKERSRRYESASELADDISRYFDQMPIVARPPSAMYRARKLLRRKRGPFAAAAVIALLTLGDVAYVGWQRSQMADAATGAGLAATLSTMAAGRVWTGPEVESGYGSVSPDGRYLSFADWESGNLAIHDFTTGENRPVTSGGTFANDGTYNYAEVSRWSPDGTQLAYTRYDNHNYDVWLTGVEGLDSRPLYSNDDVHYPNIGGWSPDGQYLSLTLLMRNPSRSTDGMQIGLLSVSDGSVHILKSFDKGEPYASWFSPDGKYFAYSHQSDETSQNRDLFLMAVDGSRDVRLTETPADEGILGWAPDGSLLFKSNRSGRYALWMISVENGTAIGSAVMLRDGLGDVTNSGTTHDGALYYVARAEGGAHAFTAAFDPETVEVVGPARPVARSSHGSTGDPAWSADGNYLAYRSQRGPESLLVIRSLSSGRETAIPLDLDSPYPWTLQWHPDGESLYLRGRLGGREGLLQFDITDGATPQIVLETTPIIQWGGPVVGPDGKTLYRIEHVSSENGASGVPGTRAIMRIDAETGQGSELHRVKPEDVGPRHHLSPDGRDIVFSTGTARAPVLNIVSTTDGVVRHLADLEYRGEPILTRGLAWTPDGNNIVFFGRRIPDARMSEEEVQRLPVRLYRIRATGGDPEPAGLELTAMETQWLRRRFGGLEPQFRPDGREIRFVAVDTSEPSAVWVLENFLPTSEGDR